MLNEKPGRILHIALLDKLYINLLCVVCTTIVCLCLKNCTSTSCKRIEKEKRIVGA